MKEEPFDPDSYRVLHAISHAEALTVLRKIGSGEWKPQLEKPEWPWHQAYCGTVAIVAAGWTVVAFNDCLKFDYIEFMQAPDGRKGDYYGFRQNGATGPEKILQQEDPGLYDRMVQAFIDAR